MRVRRRSVRRLWWRLRTLDAALGAERIAWPAVRASVASWFGLARETHAVRLSAALFARRDVRNVGKRLLVGQLVRGVAR